MATSRSAGCKADAVGRAAVNGIGYMKRQTDRQTEHKLYVRRVYYRL